MITSEMVDALEALERGDADAALGRLTHLKVVGPVAAPLGWSALLLRAAFALDALGRRQNRLLVLEEVRQKLGSMRLYLWPAQAADTDDEPVRILVNAAEDESRVRCMVCGVRSTIDTAAYNPYVVRCARHWALESVSALGGAGGVSSHGLLHVRALSLSTSEWRSISSAAHGEILRMAVSDDRCTGVLDLWEARERPFVVARALGCDDAYGFDATERVFGVEEAVAAKVGMALGLTPEQPDHHAPQDA